MSSVIGQFRTITDLLSAEKRVTCSAIKPLLKVMYTTMLNVTDSGTQLENAMKERMESDLRNRYSAVISNLLDKCSFLDPRFKQTFCFGDDPVQEIIL